MAYGKIFESLYSGSMIGKGLAMFALWPYCIANAKPPGTIELNPILIATVFGCQVAEVEQAIEQLCAPDPRSRTKDHEGRRLICEGEYLYSIPTWEKYNAIRNEIERRAQNREAQKRWRDRKQSKPPVSDGKQSKPNESTSTSVRTSTEGESVERGGDETDPPPKKPKVVVDWYPECPKDVDPAIWRQYLAIRKSKRLVPTKFAIDQLREKAQAMGSDLDTALRHCVAHTHVGFYPDADQPRRPTR